MSELSLSEFADKVTELMPVIAKEFYKQEASGFYKIHITLPQFIVLEMLVREGEMRMTDLAHMSNVSTAAMTGIVERLVKSGYVERASDPKDRRIIKIRRTFRGGRIVKNAMDLRKQMITRMFSVVSQSEREEYLRILNNVASHMKSAKGQSLQ